MNLIILFLVENCRKSEVNHARQNPAVLHSSVQNVCPENFKRNPSLLSQKAASQSCPLFLWQLDLPFPLCYTFWIQFSLLLPINQHTLTALFGIKQAHMFLQLLPMWEDNTLKVNQAICWQNWALGSAQAGWWEATGVWLQTPSKCSVPEASQNVTLHNHPPPARFMLCFEYF